MKVSIHSSQDAIHCSQDNGCVCVILPEMSLLVYMYMTTGGQERGSEGERGRRGEEGGGGREKVREGGTGEKERKEERGIRAKKDGTQTR